MLMPGRHGYSTQGGWAQGGNGITGVPGTLSISSRVSNTPPEYRASESIEFVPGFESGTGDSFETFITQESASTGSGSGGMYAGGGYRYGFNGKENDNEIKGEGNQQDYGMRIYDPRLGRFLSVDPLDEEYPYYSPYHFAGNTPLQAIDLDGTEPAYSYFENGRRVYMPAGDNLPRRIPAEHAQFIPRVTSTGGGGAGTSLSLDLLPVIGQGKAVGELITGEDYITKRELSWGERLWGLVPYAGRFIKGPKIAKALYATKKVSDVEVEVIKTTARANGAKSKVEKNIQAPDEKAIVKNKNAKDAEGHFVLYEVTSGNEKLKIGKADADRKAAEGIPVRARDSRRKARKAGYPDAEVKVIEDLGKTTTGEATNAEAAKVRQERSNGNTLPLNKEKDRRYHN